jgi:FkbM family methyltransferase
MAGQMKMVIQAIAGRFGYHIRKIERGASLTDPYVEQQRLLKGPVRTVFEVGAADGRDSERYAAMFPDARIFAFEPIPESFVAIEARARRIKSIVPLNMALAASSGKARFHIANWLDASSLLAPKETGSTFDEYQAQAGSIEVTTSTLDEQCAALGVDHIDLLKMDAQGAELQILAGARHLLERGAIDIIYTEVHFMESYQGSAMFYQLCATLADHGFALHNLYGLNQNQKGQLAWGDAIFVHRQNSKVPQEAR